jgi:hypothetical protein
MCARRGSVVRCTFWRVRPRGRPNGNAGGGADYGVRGELAQERASRESVEWHRQAAGETGVTQRDRICCGAPQIHPPDAICQAARTQKCVESSRAGIRANLTIERATLTRDRARRHRLSTRREIAAEGLPKRRVSAEVVQVTDARAHDARRDRESRRKSRAVSAYCLTLRVGRWSRTQVTVGKPGRFGTVAARPAAAPAATSPPPLHPPAPCSS